MVRRLFRALFADVLLAGMLALPASPASGVAGFGDVAADRYFTTAVQWMADEGITTGTSETCFSPDDAVTRGQAAAFLWRMESEPAAPPHPFVDVVASWQQDAVSWMFANGITTGTSPTAYSPDDELTRGQFAALLYRLADPGGLGSPAHPFTDVVASWQQEAVSWLAANAITTGTSPTEFSPDDPVTRGQIAAFLYRYKGTPAVAVDDAHPKSPVCAAHVQGPGTGYNSLFIGHSFFIPVAAELPALAEAAGLVDHVQEGVFSGGASGAPEAMWNNESVRASIQASLDAGDIELFGMTYHPFYATPTGYRLWIDYALAQNPDTMIFIGLPWSTSPGDTDGATYASTWHTAHETQFHSFIDDLRDEYPGVVIFEVGYGAAAAELYEMYDAGELPGIEHLVRTNGEPGVFADAFGHADGILLELAAHVWLRGIYGVPLSTLDNPGYQVDLRAIADEIYIAHDSDYNAP